MLAIVTYATFLAKLGAMSQSADCLRFLLEMDPADSMGAMMQFTKAGVVHQCSGDQTPGRRI